MPSWWCQVVLFRYGRAMEQETLGQNIRRIREAAGLSQAQVADEMVSRGFEGFYPQTVLKVEKGTRALKFDEGIALAGVLDVDPWGLLIPMDQIGMKALEAHTETARVVHQAQVAMENLGKHQREALRLVQEARDAGVEPLSDQEVNAIADRKGLRSASYYLVQLERVARDRVYDLLVQMGKRARDGEVSDDQHQETP